MASGNTLFRGAALGSFGPSTNYARFDTRNSVPVLKFTDITNEQSAYWLDILPANYSGGGLTLTIRGTMLTATTGIVKLGASIERRQSAGADFDADDFATEQLSAEATVAATAGVVFTNTITIANGANMDSLAAGEPFRLKIARKIAGLSGAQAAGDYLLEDVLISES